jgi:hypothetical protein
MNECLFGDLQPLTKLIQLRLEQMTYQPEQQQQLTQLASLTNLKELWVKLPRGGLPGGLPSQLQKLTRLEVSYRLMSGSYPADQYQHLSSLTTLQNLDISGFVSQDLRQLLQAAPGGFTAISPSSLAGIQHLS